LLAAAPQRAVYMGWSLGGQLALELAASNPERVAALVTVCSNPRFIADSGWPGMEAEAFAAFQAAYASDPAASLRRFGSLQAQGARRPRQLLRQLHGPQAGPPGAELLPGLNWLARLDQRELARGLQRPCLHLLAEHDQLVPAELATVLAALSAPVAQVQVLRGASHLAPLDSAPQIATATRDFLAAADLLQDDDYRETGPAKKDVASSFSRAARSYDSVARLQQDVGRELLASLDSGPTSPAVLLDLGCGTGYFQPELRRRYPGASCIGLDLAPGMVEYARAHAAGGGHWLVGDAESLPLATDAVDLIFSSLAIQWCHRPQQLFAEFGRVLRPGGRCVFTTLGPDTLRELRLAWAAVDDSQHVNTFLPPEQLAAAAESVSGIRLTLQTRRHCMQYTRVGELLAELKTLGAHNMNRGRRPGLTSRKTLQGMLQAYESWRADGLLPATYDVIFGVVETI
ncbi:MAG: malonyl-ACP O-methyltransferase BioC, partial [Halieaceae bacterium]|nr:malonyl-ACP O-methyltransferase BioC [Halieaceae bacterium]